MDFTRMTVMTNMSSAALTLAEDTGKVILSQAKCLEGKHLTVLYDVVFGLGALK